MKTFGSCIALFCLLIFVAVLPDRALSQTYQATVNGTEYEFSVLTSGNATLTILEQQFWWGDQALAESVAGTVGLGLGSESYTGTTNSCDLALAGPCSPRFAYSEASGFVFYAYSDSNSSTAGTYTWFDQTVSVGNLNYVVARAVGVPEISSSGAAASLAAIFALMLLLRDAMMRRKVVSNTA